ncbi:MAG: DNA alkylation repair protein [Christensenellales bacterium]
MKVVEQLKRIADEKYREFHKNLIPGVENVLGCRNPMVKSVAKGLSDEEKIEFMSDLPHTYYDENLCHAFCLAYLKCDTHAKLEMLDKFLPYVDNWAVCDSMVCALWKKGDLNAVYEHALNCLKSDKPFTVRYGVVCLMNKFLPERFSDFMPYVLEIKTDGYYVDMAISWLMAEALVKCYDLAVSYFKTQTFKKFIHNKSIQKATESYRLTEERKGFLRSLKVKD